MNIRIEYTEDSASCELCGPSYATGAVVYFDDVPVISLLPRAHCFDGKSYDDRAVLAAILEHLGHQLSEIPE